MLKNTNDIKGIQIGKSKLVSWEYFIQKYHVGLD